MEKFIKHTAPILAIGVAVVMLLVLFLLFVPAYINAQSAGNESGMLVGNAVGTAIGSYRGVTEDYWDGREEGKEQGLSAEDMEVTDISYIQEAGSLQVLVARVAIYDFNEVGDKYAAIYLHQGEAVFTVDLGKAEVDSAQNKIRIPMPELSLSVDEVEVDKIAEWQSSFFNGTTEDGYAAYNNSMNQIRENVEEYVENYDVLYEQAKDAAKEQVQRLVEDISDIRFDVDFLQEGDK